jgi:hypothetical protein
MQRNPGWCTKEIDPSDSGDGEILLILVREDLFTALSAGHAVLLFLAKLCENMSVRLIEGEGWVRYGIAPMDILRMYNGDDSGAHQMTPYPRLKAWPSSL